FGACVALSVVSAQLASGVRALPPPPPAPVVVMMPVVAEVPLPLRVELVSELVDEPPEPDLAATSPAPQQPLAAAQAIAKAAPTAVTVVPHRFWFFTRALPVSGGPTFSSNQRAKNGSRIRATSKVRAHRSAFPAANLVAFRGPDRFLQCPRGYAIRRR